jgi:putative tryptophan/tyrosine transport system substrate-binding protein
MRRREFIGIAGAAVAYPLATRAQQPAKLPTIGFLGANTASAQRSWTAGFVQRLQELGWVEGRNVVIEYRWAEGRIERSPEIIAEFINRKVDVIVVHGTANVIAAKQATSAIPIVFPIAGDPVANALVASLARPGGNVTGLSNQFPDLMGKRLELLREAIPGVSRLAVLDDPGNPSMAPEMRELRAAAKAIGLKVAMLEMRRLEDIAPAIGALSGAADALYVPTSPMFSTNRLHIANLSAGVQLPTMHSVRDFVAAGGLMSYGPKLVDLFRRAADIVDKILRGAKPADIPVEQPTKFELVINLKTAKVLGLEIPPLLLARADEVIE